MNPVLACRLWVLFVLTVSATLPVAAVLPCLGVPLPWSFAILVVQMSAVLFGLRQHISAYQRVPAETRRLWQEREKKT